ncbi:MAG: hypothetical protein QOE58_1504 [Actinomycetota bacterium]|nr:hypothetical protein [Actinomycetota bacterium]
MTQVIPPAASSSPTAGPPAPQQGIWRETTSTRGGRWAVAIAATAVAALMLLGIGVAGIAILRGSDRFSPMDHRQDGFSQGQRQPGNGGPGTNGHGPGGRDNVQPRQPRIPGGPGMRDGRGQGQDGMGRQLGGAALHGSVTATVNGSVQALVFQRGEVTAVSGTSVTLKSSDGFLGTYGLNATTKKNGAAPVKGGQAFVLGRASDKVALRMLARPAVGTSSR